MSNDELRDYYHNLIQKDAKEPKDLISNAIDELIKLTHEVKDANKVSSKLKWELGVAVGMLEINREKLGIHGTKTLNRLTKFLTEVANEQ